MKIKTQTEKQWLKIALLKKENVLNYQREEMEKVLSMFIMQFEYLRRKHLGQQIIWQLALKRNNKNIPVLCELLSKHVIETMTNCIRECNHWLC